MPKCTKVFFDTNTLVHQLDGRDRTRQSISRTLVKEAALHDEAVVSTQVLQEFYVVTTTKLRLDVSLVKGILRTLENMEVVTVRLELINDEVEVSIQHQLSFWDALVLVCAEGAKCERLCTEDMNDGHVTRDVKICNVSSASVDRAVRAHPSRGARSDPAAGGAFVNEGTLSRRGATERAAGEDRPTCSSRTEPLSERRL
jgi:predicted nucleic acid-binding protein